MIASRTRASGRNARSLSVGWSAALAAALLSGCSSVAVSPEQQPELRPVVAINGRAADDGNGVHYAKGKTHFMTGQLGLAVTEFQAALAEHPGSVDILNALGATYDRLGRFDLADRYYKDAITHDPKNAQTLNNLGYSLMLRGDPKRAIALLDLAKTETPAEAVIDANLKLAKSLGEAKPERDGPALSAANTQDKGSKVETVDKPQGPLSIERRSLNVQELVIKPDHRTEERANGGGGSGPLPLVLMMPPPETPGAQKVIAAPLSTVKEAPLGELRPVSVSSSAPAVAAPPSPLVVDAPPPPPVVDVPAAAAPSPRAVASAPSTPEAPVATMTISASEAPERPKLDAPIQAPVDSPKSPAGALGSAKSDTSNDDATDLVVVARTEITAAEAARMIDVPTEPVTATAARTIDVPTEPVKATATVPQPHPHASACAIEVSNGAGRDGMAARFRRFAERHGLVVGRLTNDASFRHPTTVVFYRPGFEDNARAVAALVSAPVSLQQAELDRCDVRVRLGHDLLAFDRSLVQRLTAMAAP